MSAFRPITDVWLLARPKVKYYGAFPSGFLDRARALLGVGYLDPVLHVCGGRVRDYPFRGFGPNDRTIDLDPALEPDFLMDVRRLGTRPGDLWPSRAVGVVELAEGDGLPHGDALWPAALVDRPYGPDHALHYPAATHALPEAADLLRRSLSLVRPGGRVGFLDFVAPRPPKQGVRLVALVGVLLGYGNQVRVFSVYERLTEHDAADRARARKAIRGGGA